MHAQQPSKLWGIQDFLSIVPFVWPVKVTWGAPLTTGLCWEPHAATAGCPSPSQEDSGRERGPFFPVIPKNLPSCLLQESFCSSKRRSHPQPTTCSLSSHHSLLHISSHVLQSLWEDISFSRQVRLLLHAGLVIPSAQCISTQREMGIDRWGKPWLSSWKLQAVTYYLLVRGQEAGGIISVKSQLCVWFGKHKLWPSNVTSYDRIKGWELFICFFFHFTLKRPCSCELVQGGSISEAWVLEKWIAQLSRCTGVPTERQSSISLSWSHEDPFLQTKLGRLSLGRMQQALRSTTTCPPLDLAGGEPER